MNNLAIFENPPNYFLIFTEVFKFKFDRNSSQLTSCDVLQLRS